MSLDFFRKRNDTLTDKMFIEKAICLSQKNCISLNILDSDDRMSADFITNSLLFSPEDTLFFEELLAASDLFEILVDAYDNSAITLRLGRIKK